MPIVIHSDSGVQTILCSQALIDAYLNHRRYIDEDLHIVSCHVEGEVDRSMPAAGIFINGFGGDRKTIQ